MKHDVNIGSEIMEKVVITVHVKKSFLLRVWIAIKLIALACFIGNIGLKIDRENEVESV